MELLQAVIFQQTWRSFGHCRTFLLLSNTKRSSPAPKRWVSRTCRLLRAGTGDIHHDLAPTKAGANFLVEQRYRLTAINRSFGWPKVSAPLAMASTSLAASTSPSQTALAGRTKIDQRRGGFAIRASVLHRRGSLKAGQLAPNPAPNAPAPAPTK
jgi:hypothetical protein